MEPILEYDTVGVAVPVLDDTPVLDMEGDPLEVLDLIILVVPVILACLVNVRGGEREEEADPVDVLEGRIDIVPVGDEDGVLD